VGDLDLLPRRRGGIHQPGFCAVNLGKAGGDVR
jgi:hypothetical protein